MIRINVATAAACVMALASSPAAAEGALAIGSTGNITADGLAIGFSYNWSDGQESKMALDKCKAFKAPRATPHCRLIDTFKDECFAAAMDRKEGTPGAGWAIAPSKSSAEKRALESCKATAGASRREQCVVTSSACDGTAQ